MNQITFFNSKKFFLWPYIKETVFCLRTQENYLIESKKIICLKNFLWIKKMIHSNEIKCFWFRVSLSQIKICSNKINFCQKSNKLYLWPYTNALICLFSRNIHLIQTNIYLAQRYFVWIKQILSDSNKFFLRIKKSLLNKLFSFIQSNLFFRVSI